MACFLFSLQTLLFLNALLQADVQPSAATPSSKSRSTIVSPNRPRPTENYLEIKQQFYKRRLECLEEEHKLKCKCVEAEHKIKMETLQLEKEIKLEQKRKLLGLN